MNNYAISTADLAESLTKSSGSLVAANGTLEEAVALTAAANTIMQDADVVGTALKTVSMRIRGTSVEEMEEEGVETDGVVSQSKLRGKIKALSGVDILADDGSYKSTYEILSAIADVWEDISDIDQAALLELLAGKRAGSVMSAILQNPDVLKDAFESANNATGSALKENETYLDSIQGKMDLFTNSVQNMWNNQIGSDMIKWIVSFGTKLIELTDKFGLIKTLLVGIGTYFVGKHFMGGLFSGQTINGVDRMKETLRDLQVAQEDATRAYANDPTAKNQAKLDSTSKALSNYKTQANLQIKEYDRLSAELKGLQNDATKLEGALSQADVKKQNLLSQGKSTKGVDKEITRLNNKLSETKDRIKSTEESMKIANKEATRTANTGLTVGQKFSLGFKKATNAAKTFAASAVKAIGKIAASMLFMVAITSAIETLKKFKDWFIGLFKNIENSAEKAQEKFDELNNRLAGVKDEIKSLKSELDDTQDKIDELMDSGSLTYVEQEELDRLREVSAELERQISMQETLRGSLQRGTNAASINATKKYLNTSFESEKSKTDRQEEAQETGESWGKFAGLVVGGVIGALLAPFTAGTSLAIGTGLGLGIGAGAGSMLGGFIGGALGSASAGVTYDKEETVKHAIDNMKETRASLEKARDEAFSAYASNPQDKNAVATYEEAEEKLSKYDETMAKHINQIQANYNAMDWDTSDPYQKETMKEYADLLDAYNISMGAADAKSNALARVFGTEAEGGFAKAKSQIEDINKEIKKAQDSGDEVAIAEAFEKLDNFKIDNLLDDEEEARLYEMGIYLYEVEKYFKDVTREASELVETDLEDVAKEIASITDELGELKSAFEEVIDKGYITSKTLMSLKETLGIDDSSVEEVTDAWREYLDVMMSGASTMDEMTEATERLAQAWIEEKLAGNNAITTETKYKYAAQLRDLGVTNADQYVEDLLEKNIVKELEKGFKVDKEAVREAYEEAAKDIYGPVQLFDDFDDTQIQELAEQYGLVDDAIYETKQDIIERYGVEEDAVDAIVEKLKEKRKLDQQIVDKQKKSDLYDAWRYGSGENKGILALQEELDKYKDIVDQYNKFSKEVKSFDPYYWIKQSSSVGTVVYNWSTYEQMDVKTYERLKKEKAEYEEWIKLNSTRYQEYEALKKQYDKLWTEGESKGYIVNGEIIDPDFQKEIDDLNEQIDGITTEIDKELTVDIELKLQLQEFDDAADKIQDVYSSLKDITTEYNTQGYLSLDNLQALLSLSPEYLAVLKMENGQLVINQTALQQMLETKLDDAEATAVQTAITQLNALAERKQAIAIDDGKKATIDATSVLGTYADALGIVASKAIIAAGSVDAFKSALSGAQNNEFVSDAEWEQVLTNYKNTVDLIGSVRENLSSSLNNILDPGSKTSEEEVADDRFQKAMDYWENRISANQAKSEQVQNEIDLMEKKGQKADASFYEEIIDLENERLWLLEKQKEEAQFYLSEFDEGSEEYWEIANTLNEIEGELDDVTASIVDLQDAIGEIDTYKFDEFNNRLDDLTSKLETIRNLIAPDGEEDWFDNEGNWTEAGVAVLGSQIQALETYKQGYQNTMDELAKYEPDYTGNESYYESLGIHSEQEYYDAVEKLTDQQYKFAESINDTEQDIVGMYESSIDSVEEYVDTLIEGYNDYIDSVKEALDAERSLYDFKKNVQKQAKDVAELERRIASLSGSTNASDVAERRKLEAELYEARESLNDTYYDHAQESQQNALDAEAEAYEETMTKFVEGLRTSLEEATLYMDEFLMGVTAMVMYNADAVLGKYQETNLPLTEELTNPWEQAKDATSSYSGNALELMNEWMKSGGFFSQFNAAGTSSLTSLWGAGTNAVEGFRNNVFAAMSQVVTNIGSNVKSASSELSSLYAQIQETERRAASANVSVGSGSDTYVAPQQKKYYITKTLSIGGENLSVTESDVNASTAMSKANIAILGKYEEYQKKKGVSELNYESAWQRTWRSRVKTETQYYATGTTGTKRNEWAVTDEPQFGDELVLIPGKNGNLSFMRKGTSVIPANLAANLMEWGQITPESMSLGGGVNINMINNAVNKPEFNLNFEALVKAERIDENTLPEVKRFVQQEINSLVKQMNYAIKGKGGR